MNRTPHLRLPVGEKPSWENEGDGELDKPLDLKSVFASSVVYQSLKQSRDKWLTLTFPKFASKARGGKPASIVPLPHTIQTRGRCDIEIGPHIFSNTTIFEVHYLSPQAPSTPKPGSQYQPSQNSWQATTPYGGTPFTAYGQQNTSEKVPSFGVLEQQSSRPLLSSIASSVSITPVLINQVNSAASSNPTLANLLQLAATGKATPEQLKTLGLLIQSLANPNMVDTNNTNTVTPPPPLQQPTVGTGSLSSASSNTGSYSQQSSLAPVREFDIVLEFSENATERWVFPRGPAVCERIVDSRTADIAYDVLVSTCLPFPKLGPEMAIQPAASTTPQTVHDEDSPRQLVTFRLRKAPITIWDTISRWVGGEDNITQNRKILNSLPTHDRVYLAHQLPDGPVLSQVQNAVALPFSTKPIKPGQSTTSKPRRKPQRKPTALATNLLSTPSEKKKQKASQAKNNTPLSRIACFTCGQADVPLIMGGRFCRPCVMAGKGVIEIPQVGATGGYSYQFSAMGPSTPTAVIAQVPPATPEASSSAVPLVSAPGTSDQSQTEPPAGKLDGPGNK